MRNILTLICIYFLLSLSVVNANWYWSTPVSYNVGWERTKTQCPWDGDIRWGTPTGYNGDVAVGIYSNLNPEPAYNTYSLYSLKTNHKAVYENWTMYCFKWDGYNPYDLEIEFSKTWWTNQDVTIQYRAKDAWWSKLKSVVLQQSINDGPFGLVDSWNWSSNTMIKTYTRTKILNTQRTKVEFRIVATDHANKQTTFISPHSILFDTIWPSINDVSTTVWDNLNANNNKSFKFTVNAQGWSPIDSTEWTMENITWWADLKTSTSWVLSFFQNISKVDNDRESNGARVYTFKLKRVCDEAWNCITHWDTLKNYNFNVFADITSIANTNTKVLAQNVTSTANIANGAEKYINYQLKDQYSNIIIQATWINRKINLTIPFKNSVRLDQYSRTWESWIMVKGPNWWYASLAVSNSWNQTYTNVRSTNGQYKFSVKSFTPTYNSSASDGRQLAYGAAEFNNAKVNITDSINSAKNHTIPSSARVPNFKPMYVTNFTWEIINDGFIEWAEQKNNLSIAKLGTTTVSQSKVYLEFWAQSATVRDNVKVSYTKTNWWIPNTAISESSPLRTVYQSGISPWNKVFNTLFELETWTLSEEQKIYLSSHIRYNISTPIGTKTVIYNSGIIWKDRYHWAYSTENAIQSGVKIVWSSQVDSYKEIVSGQSGVDVIMIWDNNKGLIKKEIRENAYSFVKLVTPNNWTNKIIKLDDSSGWGSFNWWVAVWDILYFWNLWGSTVILDSSTEKMKWVKTIIVEGGNLYLKSNLEYSNSTSNLWVIVLEDSWKRWWNIYVNPSVTKLVWSYYADKSMISYNGTELDWNTPQAVLKHQLYLLGSVMSENTIWGSRKNPVECPYFVPSGSCTTRAQAQKYDLNYLRRYYIAPNNTPANGWTANYPSSSDYYKHPMIIEYNPLIQTSPPPLFVAD